MAPVDQQSRRRGRFHTSPNGTDVKQVFRATHCMAQEVPALG